MRHDDHREVMLPDERIRVLIVDDHPVVRRGLLTSLAEAEAIEVVGEATNGLEAIDQAEKLSPDVILMDISMPKLGGLEAIQRLKALHPNTRVLVLTVHYGPEYAVSAARAGARGLVVKDAPIDDVIEGIEQLHLGNLFFSGTASSQIVETFIRESKADSEQLASPAEPGPTHAVPLSSREREVLSLVAAGHTSKQIASRLRISTRTVEAHRARIADKTGVRTVAGLTRYAVEHGLAES